MPEPVAAVIGTATAYWLSRNLHVIATLGVADRLNGPARSLAAVAGECDADAAALGRVLRLLAAHGIFTFDGQTVGHTAASLLLRSDHPQTLRSFVRFVGSPLCWNGFPANSNTRYGPAVRHSTGSIRSARSGTWLRTLTKARSSMKR
jgi:hypothetical protein